MSICDSVAHAVCGPEIERKEAAEPVFVYTQ
jgi:hypothetical protein